MDQSKIKVTDRRLFTEEGELRADLESYEDSAQEPAATRPAPTVAATPDARSDAAAPTSPEPPAPGPEEAEAAGSPQFLDLVDLLCQQVALALGDPRLGAGAPPPDLQIARLYIDLLAVLQEKTRGNLTDEEAAVLEELVYRFRMLYVEKQRR